MRRYKALAGLTAGMMLLGGAALAAGPTLKITSPTSASVLEYTSFPQTVDVVGTVAYTGGSGGNTNLCGVKDLTVTVDDGAGQSDSVVQIGYLAEVAGGSPAECVPQTIANWSYPWGINQPGEYTIRATAKVVPDQVAGEATEEVVVTEITMIATFPAAPSVAAKLLSDADVPARYGKGKEGGNYIADVAHQMGPGTDFNGISKRDVSAYKAEVEAFLMEKGAL